MRNLNRIFILAAAVMSMAFRCSGEGEDLDVTLETDVTSIPADGQTYVTFTVYEGNADVTSESVIYDFKTGQPLLGNMFSTSRAGEYSFYAKYGAKKTDVVKVVAEDVVVSQFVRNVCLMEFTDSQCSFCPDASRYIDRNILQKNDKVHLMAFHEKDQWKSDQFRTLFDKFKLTGTPAASIDMRRGISLETGNRDALKEAIAESESGYPAHCGVAVSSSVDAQGKTAITVKLHSEKSADYYLAVYIVEDGLKGPQLDGSLTTQEYYHQFVVRQMLSKTVYGDGLGRLTAGQETTKEYTVACDAGWNRSKTYVYALAIDADGYVNNMQVCLLDGGDTDYEKTN